MNNIVFIPGPRPGQIVQLYWREILDILPTDQFLDPRVISARGCLGGEPPGVDNPPRRGETLKRARRLSA